MEGGEGEGEEGGEGEEEEGGEGRRREREGESEHVGGACSILGTL